MVSWGSIIHGLATAAVIAIGTLPREPGGQLLHPGMSQKGGERAYRGRLGKDRSSRESQCEREIGFTAQALIYRNFRRRVAKGG